MAMNLENLGKKDRPWRNQYFTKILIAEKKLIPQNLRSTNFIGASETARTVAGVSTDKYDSKRVTVLETYETFIFQYHEFLTNAGF